jgi:ligand-binding sensor domain-containing protein/AraC-like DNA-binding protein
MKKRIIFLEVLLGMTFILNLCTSLHPSAADPMETESFGSFQHHVWTNDNGLPMNTVMAVNQTPDGYLWVGTEAGLARFDGVKFDVFTQEDTPAFSSNLIIALLVDHEGTLWIVTQLGGIVRRKNGIFESVAKNTGHWGNEVWCIMESSDHCIWIGSKTGLFRLSEEKLIDISLPDSLSTHFISALLEDHSGRIWAGTRGDGLVLVKKRGSNFEAEHFALKGVDIITLYEDRQDALWIGTESKGLFRYWGSKMLDFTSENGLSSDAIRCLHEDRFGNLWIGTYGGGINILARRGEQVSITSFQSQEEFSSDIILCFYPDLEGTLWFGTNGGGLYSLREAKITTYTTKNGLSYNNVYGVFQDSSGKIWVGTKGYGANYFDPGDHRFHQLTTRDGLSSASVVSFTQDRSGALWFGTLGGGINRLKNGRIDVFDQRHGLANTVLRAIYTDHAGNVWAGTVNGGIYRFLNDTFVPVANVNVRVNTLAEDSNKNLWIGTFGSGLCRLDPEKGNLEVFNKTNGLSNNIVTCIHEDSSGILWIGTLNGLNRFQAGNISILDKKHGLPDETSYWILEDNKRDLWISSNHGIYCLNRKEINAFFEGTIPGVNPTVFGKEAGMHSIECNGGNHPAGWKTQDNKLWFPTTFGVSVIDPMNIGLNKIPPPLVIEKIIIDKNNIPVEPTIAVPSGKNNLEIHYTAPSFIVPDKILFKYKMEGYDKQWVQAGNKRIAYYSGVPAGKYRFRVIACNSDGVWNETGTSVLMHLQRRLLKTPEFIVILLVVLALSGFFLYYYLKRSAPRQELKPKEKPKNSTLDSQESKKYVQKLFYVIEVEKMYKDPQLSVKSLASKLVITPRNLSHIINDQLNTNFYDFINEYRIKEAQCLLSVPEPCQQSILNIAYEVGYNSKSAFNRAFKNITQMTPSQFRKKVKK